MSGASLFTQNCAGCHARDRVLVGPSLVEIAGLYRGMPEGVVTWAQAPGKKRAAMPQMPAFAALGEAKLALIAAYMLEQGASPP